MNEILTLDNKLESGILTTNSPLLFVIEVMFEPTIEIFANGNGSSFSAFITLPLNSIKFSSFLTSLFCECIDIETNINKICSSMACHGSIRAGRQMYQDEMNKLLREMESTPFSGQCNHGRPTYIELNLNQIESLFGRK